MIPFDRLTRIMLDDSADFLLREFSDLETANLVVQIGSAQRPDGLLDEEWKRLPYRLMPHMPKVESLAQHSLEFIWGRIGDFRVLVLSGRYHYYEGYGRAPILLPVWAAASLGLKTFLFTNASGAINDHFAPGDFMIIRDHINNLGVSPLAGHHHLISMPYADMSHTYSADLISSLKRAAAHEKVEPKEGVYMANQGPQYETPAEVRAAHAMGADAVGMSTVLEATVAHALGARVAALSMIVNRASGQAVKRITPAESDAVGHTAGRQMIRVIRRWINDEGPNLFQLGDNP